MEIPRGRGISKTKISKGKCESKLEFPGRGGGGELVSNQIASVEGMDIFWNHTIDDFVKTKNYCSFSIIIPCNLKIT